MDREFDFFPLIYWNQYWLSNFQPWSGPFIGRTRVLLVRLTAETEPVSQFPAIGTAESTATMDWTKVRKSYFLNKFSLIYVQK